MVKRHDAQPDDPAMFDVEHYGSTTYVSPEPSLDKPQTEAAPEPVIELSTPAVQEAVHKAVVADNRRRGQLGKHSPLERSGDYTTVKVGDYLPGFGPVTYRNFGDAELHAHRLQSKRSAHR